MCAPFRWIALTSRPAGMHLQEYNICFTTVARPTPDADGNVPPAMPPPASAATGVLPRLIGNLVARRREVKNLLKAEAQPARKAQLDIRQKVRASVRLGLAPFLALTCYDRLNDGRFGATLRR